VLNRQHQAPRSAMQELQERDVELRAGRLDEGLQDESHLRLLLPAILQADIGAAGIATPLSTALIS
jgi:hypothetical protein